MKKFFISLGLMAAGTASMQAAYAPNADAMQSTKIWSVSSTLRGFYDDNYTTSPNGQKQGSAGFEVSPSVGIDVPLQQTEIGLRYTYGLYYYQERQNQGNDPIDQSHEVDLWLDHAFTEQWQVKVADTLAIGQEPTLLNPVPAGSPPGASANPYRVDGNNLANTGTIALTTDWTRLFSTVLTYNNSYYAYQNNGTTEANLVADGASQSAILNRIDQFISLDLQWHIAPETIALIGGQFEAVNYTGDQPIAINPVTGGYYWSDSRNNNSYFGYVGLQRNWLPNLNSSTKIGVQYTDNYNDSSPNTTTPYVLSSLTYTYLPGSYVELGVSHEQNATDVVTPNSNNGQITQSQQSTVVSLSLNQEITAKLTGSVIGSFQYSTYNQGAYSDEADEMYSLGLNLNYAFTQHFSGEVGYNFDDLQSNIPSRGYSRNRVYVGVTAAY
jgi:Putative beta-barrel porin 2